MHPWLSGTAASVASTLALVMMGRRELRDASAPLNGPSQWVWGTHAPYRSGFSLRHTGVGYGIHHLAATLWATVYERLVSGASRRGAGGRDVGRIAAAAIGTATLAGVVDFGLTPERFTPGFEKRLSKRALVVVYAAFAAGLAASTLWRDRVRRR